MICLRGRYGDGDGISLDCRKEDRLGLLGLGGLPHGWKLWGRWDAPCISLVPVVGGIKEGAGSDWLLQESCRKQDWINVLGQILEGFGGRWKSCSFSQKPRACGRRCNLKLSRMREEWWMFLVPLYDRLFQPQVHSLSSQWRRLFSGAHESPSVLPASIFVDCLIVSNSSSIAEHLTKHLDIHYPTN